MSKKFKIAVSAGLLLLVSAWAVPSIGSMTTGPFWHFRNSIRLENVINHGKSEMEEFFSTDRTQTEALGYLEDHGMHCSVMSRQDKGDPSPNSVVACGHNFGILFGIDSRWYAVARIDSQQRVASFKTGIVCSICP